MIESPSGEGWARSERISRDQLVTGVPMFVIGSQVMTGLQDRETLEAVIEEGLNTQETSMPR